MIDTTTQEGQAKRIEQIAGEHIKKSKQVNDHHWRMANGWTGLGDHTQADYGTHWSD